MTGLAASGGSPWEEAAEAEQVGVPWLEVVEGTVERPVWVLRLH